MRVCEFCGKALPDQAGFCGHCGQTSFNHSPEALTSRGTLLTAVEEDDVEARPTITTPSWEWEDALPGKASQKYSNQPAPDYGIQQLSNVREEEEEKRWRAALLDMGLPGFSGEEQLAARNLPMVQGTPPLEGVSFVQGTPQGPGGSFAQGIYAASGLYSTPTLSIPTPQYSPQPPIVRHPRLPHRPHSPHHQHPVGCAPTWLILLFAAIIITTSIISIGFTVLSPSLTLIGSTDVSLGDSLHLHGSGFVPVSAVILTLDNTTPLYYSSDNSTMQAFSVTNTMMGLGVTTLQTRQALVKKTIVTVGVDGSFNVFIAIDQSWHTGQHTIRAAERTFPRSAVIAITVHQAGETPTSTSLATATPSATPSPSDTASPSATPSGLSCVNPSSVTLGPVSENYDQAISTQVSLCTAGSGNVDWTASWDQQQAPWLKLDHSTGEIQAPGQQQINVNALASKLKAGTYTATVTFSSQQSSTTEALNVTFTVQTGCIHTSQQQLSFTGVEKVSDPQAQTLTVTNCGIVGSWSTSISTGDNVNWLSGAPANGSLNSGAAQSVTIKASSLKTQLGAGTYSGKIVFSIGSNQVSVNVTLTVVPGAMIVLNSPSSGSFNANKDCSFGPNGNQSGWTCIASISDSSTSLSLNWKSSSTGVPNITFSPSSGTLTPNGTARVIIFVPTNNCQTTTTLTFTGPANTVNIAWSCTGAPGVIG